MEQIIIGVRELQRNLRKISNKALKGQAFVVVRNAKPLFKITPIAASRPKYTLKDFRRLEFDSGERNLSRRIDEIVYLGERV